MKEVTITISSRMMQRALVSLEWADTDLEYAAELKAALLEQPCKLPRQQVGALHILIRFALANPGGHVERILRDRGFLVPELTSGHVFSVGSH